MFGDALQLRGELAHKDEEKPLPSHPSAKTHAQPSPVVQRGVVSSLPRNTTGLPDNLKAGVESLSGLSMEDVKVHYNSAEPAQLNALAYAQGSDIHVAPGQ